MEEQMRTIGYLCPECGKAVVARRSAFQLAASDSHIPCPCGRSELVIRQQGDRCEITAPCPVCAHDHTASCSENALLRRSLVSLPCPAAGLACCFVGEEERVFAAMERLEQAVDKLVMDSQAQTRGSFLDDIVMGEVLGEVKDIAGRGGISCACGSHDYGMRVGFSWVDLMCARCGAVLRLPAATPDDVDAVCSRYTLTIPGKAPDEKERG